MLLGVLNYGNGNCPSKLSIAGYIMGIPRGGIHIVNCWGTGDLEFLITDNLIS